MPSIITLHYTNAPMMDVLEDFARQAHADMGIHRDRVVNYSRQRRLSIDVNRVSFWEALRRIEEASELRISWLWGSRLALQLNDGPNQLDDPNMLSGPAKISGAFLIAPTSSNQNHAVWIDEKNTLQLPGKSTGFGFNALILVEPKIRLLSPLPNDWLAQMTDDTGNELAKSGERGGNILRSIVRLNCSLTDLPSLATRIIHVSRQPSFQGRDSL